MDDLDLGKRDFKPMLDKAESHVLNHPKYFDPRGNQKSEAFDEIIDLLVKEFGSKLKKTKTEVFRRWAFRGVICLAAKRISTEKKNEIRDAIVEPGQSPCIESARLSSTGSRETASVKPGRISSSEPGQPSSAGSRQPASVKPRGISSTEHMQPSPIQSSHRKTSEVLKRKRSPEPPTRRTRHPLGWDTLLVIFRDDWRTSHSISFSTIADQSKDTAMPEVTMASFENFAYEVKRGRLGFQEHVHDIMADIQEDQYQLVRDDQSLQDAIIAQQNLGHRVFNFFLEAGSDTIVVA